MNHRNGVQGKALILAGGLTAFTLVLARRVHGSSATDDIDEIAEKRS